MSVSLISRPLLTTLGHASTRPRTREFIKQRSSDNKQLVEEGVVPR